MHPRYAAVLLLLAPLLAAAQAPSSKDKRVDFDRDIRPILSDNCLRVTVRMKNSARSTCAWTRRRESSPIAAAIA